MDTSHASKSAYVSRSHACDTEDRECVAAQEKVLESKDAGRSSDQRKTSFSVATGCDSSKSEAKSATFVSTSASNPWGKVMSPLLSERTKPLPHTFDAPTASDDSVDEYKRIIQLSSSMMLSPQRVDTKGSLSSYPQRTAALASPYLRPQSALSNTNISTQSIESNKHHIEHERGTKISVSPVSSSYNDMHDAGSPNRFLQPSSSIQSIKFTVERSGSNIFSSPASPTRSPYPISGTMISPSPTASPKPAARPKTISEIWEREGMEDDDDDTEKEQKWKHVWERKECKEAFTEKERRVSVDDKSMSHSTRDINHEEWLLQRNSDGSVVSVARGDIVLDEQEEVQEDVQDEEASFLSSADYVHATDLRMHQLQLQRNSFQRLEEQLREIPSTQDVPSKSGLPRGYTEKENSVNYTRRVENDKAPPPLQLALELQRQHMERDRQLKEVKDIEDKMSYPP